MVAHESRVTALDLINYLVHGVSRLPPDKIVKFNDMCDVNVWKWDAWMLERAQPYAWSAECTAAVLESSHGVPDDTVIASHNLPTGFSWFHFERPLPIQTLNDLGVGANVRALCMGWVGDTFLMTSWVDEPRTGSCPTQCWSWIRGETLAEMKERVTESYLEQYGPGGKRERVPHVGEPTFSDVSVKLSRFILAAHAWVTQKILVHGDGAIERHRRKDYVRKHGVEPLAVKVVQLRRVERKVTNQAGQSSVEWSCRWMVGGHWRNQACGVKHGERRLRYIEPFLKGPDDKPLRVSERVFEVAR